MSLYPQETLQDCCFKTVRFRVGFQNIIRLPGHWKQMHKNCAEIQKKDFKEDKGVWKTHILQWLKPALCAGAVCTAFFPTPIGPLKAAHIPLLTYFLSEGARGLLASSSMNTKNHNNTKKLDEIRYDIKMKEAIDFNPEFKEKISSADLSNISELYNWKRYEILPLLATGSLATILLKSLTGYQNIAKLLGISLLTGFIEIPILHQLHKASKTHSQIKAENKEKEDIREDNKEFIDIYQGFHTEKEVKETDTNRLDEVRKKKKLWEENEKIFSYVKNLIVPLFAAYLIKSKEKHLITMGMHMLGVCVSKIVNMVSRIPTINTDYERWDQMKKAKKAFEKIRKDNSELLTITRNEKEGLTFSKDLVISKASPPAFLDMHRASTVEEYQSSIQASLNNAFKDNNNQILMETKEQITIPKGSVIKLSGESGSGKSTLLRSLFGHNLYAKGKMNIPTADNKTIGYVPQSPKIDAYREIYDNITYPKKATNEDKKRLDNQLKFLELKGCLKKYTGKEEGKKYDYDTLSGGERKKIALLQALHRNPDFLILDEVTTGLDKAQNDKDANSGEEKCMELIKQWHTDDKTFFYIEHAYPDKNPFQKTFHDSRNVWELNIDKNEKTLSADRIFQVPQSANRQAKRRNSI